MRIVYPDHGLVRLQMEGRARFIRFHSVRLSAVVQKIEGDHVDVTVDGGQLYGGVHGPRRGFVHEHIIVYAASPVVAEPQLRIVKADLHVRGELLLELGDEGTLVRVNTHPVHAQSLFLELVQRGKECFRIFRRVWQDQTAVALFAHLERTVARDFCWVHGRAAVFLFGEEAVDGENVVVDVRVGEQLGRDARRHRGEQRAHPFRLAVVEDRGVGTVHGSLKEMRDDVSVSHQERERFILRVHTAAAEMGRTIGIRERRRERVRHEAVDPTHEHMVEEIAHAGRALRPAVRAEDLAHRASLHLRVDMRERGAEFGKHAVEEGGIAPVPGGGRGVDILSHAGHDLVEHHVDAAHVLTVEGTEIVRRAASEPGVRFVVLDDVADILYAVRPAPVAELAGEAVAVQARYGVHVGVADLSGLFAHIAPERGDIRHGIVPRHLRHAAHHLALAPRIRHAGQPHARFVILVLTGVLAEPRVADARLVREEPADRLAEFVLVMRVMRLVYGVDEEPDGFRVHHVDVFLRHCPAPGLVEEIDPVTAVRDVEAQVPALYVRGQINRLRRDLLRVSGARIGVDADEAVFLVRDPAQKDRRGGKRPHHVEVLLADLPRTQFRMGFHRAIRVPGREVVVVEDPHAHIALFCLG